MVICEPQSVASARIDRSAPFDTRNFTISGWFCAAAHITADWSRMRSRRLTSAPSRTSASATRDVARPCRQHQRRLAVLVGDVGVRPGFEEQLDQRHVGHFDRLGERARAIAVDDVGARAPPDQRQDQLAIDLVGGPVQRRRAVSLRLVDVGALRNHLQRRLAIAA